MHLPLWQKKDSRKEAIWGQLQIGHFEKNPACSGEKDSSYMGEGGRAQWSPTE